MANASSVGANKVKGPSDANVSIRSAASSAESNVSNPSWSDATSGIGRLSSDSPAALVGEAPSAAQPINRKAAKIVVKSSLMDTGYTSLGQWGIHGCPDSV